MKKCIYILIPVLLLALVVGSIGCGEEETPELTPTPGEQATPSPGEQATPTPSPGATPTPPGVAQNFRLLISDDENAIGDFEHLYIEISRVGIHKVDGSGNESGNESGQWLEFPPQVEVIDLVPLQGENAQVIWGGNITAGTYNKVFIYVSAVWGELTPAMGNETANMKLPSNKLQISRPFVITDDSVTSFVYDVSVVATGSDKNGKKYILKPQLAKSGADQEFEEVTLGG